MHSVKEFDDQLMVADAPHRPHVPSGPMIEAAKLFCQAFCHYGLLGDPSIPLIVTTATDKKLLEGALELEVPTGFELMLAQPGSTGSAAWPDSGVPQPASVVAAGMYNQTIASPCPLTVSL